MTKKRILIAVLLGIIGIGVVGFSLRAPKVFASESVQGVVMSAGNSQLMIVPAAGDVLEFSVAPNARIMRDGEVSELQELHPKDHVSVTWTGNGEERTATEIVARSPY